LVVPSFRVGSRSFPSVVTRFGSSVYLLPTIRGGRQCKVSLRCSVVVGCVVSRVASRLYRVAFLALYRLS
jgi:hypothetical protein